MISSFERLISSRKRGNQWQGMYIWSHLKDAHDPAVAAHVGYEPNLLRGPLIVLPRYEGGCRVEGLGSRF
jgi:hypothetical protein